MHKIACFCIVLPKVLAPRLLRASQKQQKKMATTKFYLDTRKGEAPYNLKLTITHERKAVHLLLNVKLHPEQWDGVKIVKHPRAGMLNNQLVGRKADIDSLLYEWQRAGKLNGKSVTDIKKMLQREEGRADGEAGTTFGRHFRAVAERKKGQTRTTYFYTLATLADFCDIDNVSFEEITPKWLQSFDSWCKHSQNTRCLHYRYMRAVFNDAIDEGLTNAYPFRKFKIKAGETKDRALTLAELQELWQFPVEQYQEKYLDYFKLIFLLRGINVIDLAHLTRKNVQKGRIVYSRAKTQKPYSIKIEPEIQELLNKHKGNNYLVDILERYCDHSSFISKLNKELKKIGKCELGKRGKKTITPLFPGLSSYWARHTFAHIGYNECELSMDVISDLLGHSHGLAVTNVYVRKNVDKIDKAARKIIDKVLYNK